MPVYHQRGADAEIRNAVILRFAITVEHVDDEEGGQIHHKNTNLV